MRRAIRPVLTMLTAFGGLFLSTGCALINAEIHRTPPNGTLPTTLGRGREVIVDIPFSEGRRKLGRCGMKKNGYNMDSADIVCSEAPGSWLAHSIAAGLVRAGFRVLTPTSPPGPSTVIVRGTVSQFFVEPNIGMWHSELEADIGLTLVLTSPSGLVATRRFYVKGEHSSAFQSEAEAQGAADDATDEMVRVTVTAIGTLLDRYPGLGAPSVGPVASVP